MNISADLVQKAAAGNEAAITELYEQTYNSVYHTVRSMVRDEDTVLDILQDSYIKAFQSLSQLTDPASFLPWIKRIAVNKARDDLKKRKPILFTEMATEDEEMPDIPDDRADHLPEAMIDRRETTRLMNEILQSLSEDQQMVIGMFYYEQMSVRQIALTLGCSENTVKSRLNYGRKKIEIKVRELEKQGTKLYSLAPLPFLVWLLRSALQEPSAKILHTIQKTCGTAGKAAAVYGAHSAAQGAQAATQNAQAAVRVGAKAAARTGAKAAVKAGAKALTTKIIAAVLAVTVVGGGAVAAGIAIHNRSTQPEDSIASHIPTVTESVTNPASRETEPPVISEETEQVPADTGIGAYEAYESILTTYREACSLDSAQWNSSKDQYENLSIHYLDLYHDLDQFHFFYQYYDIDGNGSDELLIGCGWEGDVALAGVYTFDGSNAVEWLDNNGTLLADGTLLLQDFENNVFTLYQLGSDGFTLEVVETQETDSANAGAVWWSICDSHGGFFSYTWSSL